MKAMRWIALLVLSLVVVVGLGAAYMLIRYPRVRPATTETIAATPERLARGQYLAEHVADCFGCHTERAADRFSAPPVPALKGSGGMRFDHALGFPGTIIPPNITSDRETGIGAWTDGELLRTLREGVGRDGHTAFPFSPYLYYRHMSDEDARSVIAYLKTVPAIPHQVPPSEIDFPVSLFIRVDPAPVEAPVEAPPKSDHVRYGEYLVTIAGCVECHSAYDGRGQIIAGHEFAGGFPVKGPWGTKVSTNITAAPGAYLSTATRDDFIGRFKGFSSPSFDQVPKVEPASNTPMPWYTFSGMTEEDLGDIYDYLKTLPVHTPPSGT